MGVQAAAGHQAAVDAAGGGWPVVPRGSAAGLLLVPAAVGGVRDRVQVDLATVRMPERDGDRPFVT